MLKDIHHSIFIQFIPCDDQCYWAFVSKSLIALNGQRANTNRFGFCFFFSLPLFAAFKPEIKWLITKNLNAGLWYGHLCCICIHCSITDRFICSYFIERKHLAVLIEFGQIGVALNQFKLNYIEHICSVIGISFQFHWIKPFWRAEKNGQKLQVFIASFTTTTTTKINWNNNLRKRLVGSQCLPYLIIC